MKVSKDAAKAANRIFKLCSQDGKLDEGKFSKAITLIAESKPRDYRAILHSLRRLVRLDIESRKAVVESATEMEADVKSRLESNLNEQYGGGLSFTYTVSPELLGGTRIRVGNDVWDASVKSRLDRLANAF
ncbi:MAG: FoF1 ATP synthase subunit delta [Akkermansiaceae bacterium]